MPYVMQSTADIIANNVLMQKAVTLNTRHIVRKYLAEQCIARKVDDDADNNNNTNNSLHVIIPSQCRCNIFLDLLLLSYLLQRTEYFLGS
jgi:hypothetical protein